ncbi:MAG TPA: FAD-dependent oxidoreductase [Acetobacteraceae bacterium]|nr:FAD-dependent oxidoreductase [Acetobacteraceae bacterium]
MQRIAVVGAGFAGLWAALAAARLLDRHGVGPEAVEVALVDPNPWHSIRVRNYESDLPATLVPLAEVCGPAGVTVVQAEATGINLATRQIPLGADGAPSLAYDRVVLALGSRLLRPPVLGLAEHGFDIDTYPAAVRLMEHLAGPAGQGTVLIVGAGLTGIELATELRSRPRGGPRVILADRASHVGSDMGAAARDVIDTALAALGVETRPGVTVASVDPAGVGLADGGRIAAETVVWCGGMRAHPLAAGLGLALDPLGRLPVDTMLRVVGADAAFAAGDIACLAIDPPHVSVMSCQHARPMGRFAGHNAAADLLGEPLLPLAIGWYVTVLDLGGWGAVQTAGWDRHVIASGGAAKRVKQTINRERIYPPRTGDRAAILAAAAPEIQAPPASTAQ